MWPFRRSINFSRIIDAQMDDPRGADISTLTLSRAGRCGRSRGPAPSDLAEASSSRRLGGAACPRARHDKRVRTELTLSFRSGTEMEPLLWVDLTRSRPLGNICYLRK
jgi:hypothetical protein